MIADIHQFDVFIIYNRPVIAKGQIGQIIRYALWLSVFVTSAQFLTIYRTSAESNNGS